MPDVTSQLLLALSVVLDHPVLASDPLLLCSAAQVCGSWRGAVAASGAGTTDVTLQDKPVVPGTVQPDESDRPMPGTPFDPEAPTPEWIAYAQPIIDRVAKVQGLPSWLCKHAHLVRSITLAKERGGSAASVLNPALEPGSIAEGLQLPRLQRFSANDLSDLLLAALPDSLAELRLTGFNISSSRAAAGNLQVLHKCIARLKGLRSLTLKVSSTFNKAGELDLSPLGQMVHLTQLKLDLGHHFNNAEWSRLNKALLCLTSLERLSLVCAEHSLTPRTLRLQGLTALREADISLVSAMLVDGPKLPAQLSRLSLDCTWMADTELLCPVTAFGLKSLQHLRDLKLSFHMSGLTDLPGTSGALQQLTQLTRLQLDYGYTGVMLGDGSCWAKLPALMAVSTDDDDPVHWGTDTFQQVFADLGRVTALTRLDLHVQSYDEIGPVAFCSHLTGLSCLQELALESYGGHVAARDGLHLTALTTLTKLSLGYLGAAVDDAVAVALAYHLPQLQWLDLSGCALQTDAVLPILAQRERLDTLILRDIDCFKEQVLAGIAEFNRCGQPSLAALL